MEYAYEMLKRCKYYSFDQRLQGSVQNPDTANCREDVCFNDIVTLYEFDERLRALVFGISSENRTAEEIRYFFLLL